MHQIFFLCRQEMHQLLQEAKVPSKIILDSAIGWVCKLTCIILLCYRVLSLCLPLAPVVRFIMEAVDLVIVGAEGVAESGGVINKVSDHNIMHSHSRMQYVRYIYA